MTNQEYIDAINKALEILERHKQIVLSGEIKKGCDVAMEIERVKRLCTQCLAAYVGGPVCSCGNRYTSEI